MRAGFPQSSLPPFPPLPPPATPAQVADTISYTDSRVSEMAYLTPRAADGTRARHQARAVTAPLRLRHPMRRRRRRRQVRRCPFNRCRSSSKLCDVRCHLLRDVCRQQTPGSTCHSCWPYADTWPALVTTLAASAPVRATDLAAAIWSAAEADADPGATTEDCTHVCTCVGAQQTARLTLRQAVHAAAGADGYLTAATQSAFLQLFGGVTLAAEAAALADRARACLQTAAPRAPFIGGVAVQQDVLRRRAMRSAEGGSPRAASCAKARTALGAPWLVSKGAAGCEPALDHVLALLFQKKMSFQKHYKKLKCPYVIYGDFECLTTPSSEGIKGTYQHHKPCGFMLNVVNSITNEATPYLYRGEDCMDRFCSTTNKIKEEIMDKMKENKKLQWTTKQQEQHKKEKRCFICGGKFNPKDPAKTKVADHCHFTGQYRGAAHNKCNLDYCFKYFKVPVFFITLNITMLTY